MKRIRKAIDKLEEDFSSIEIADNFTDWDYFDIIVKEGINVVNAAIDKQSEVFNRNLVIREYRKINAEETVGNIEKTESGRVITINRNLPKRNKNGKFMYDKSFFRDSIEPELRSFIESRAVRLRMPVVITITSYYKTKSELVDYDNMDIKPVIDLIAAYCLPDDNPMYYDLVLRSGIGKEHKTVIQVREKGERL